MDFEKLTYKSKDVIEAVVNLAVANKNQYITPLHLLKVLLNGKNELILNLIAQAGGDIVQIRDKLDNAFAKAFGTVFEKGTGIIEKTYSKEKADEKYFINHTMAARKKPSRKALKSFNPLFSLNYSATHAKEHNLIYVLDALDAASEEE